MSAPYTTKALTVVKNDDHYDAVIRTKEIPLLKPNQILVKIIAAAFNHRELWIRKAMYPSIGDGATYGADGCGIVVESGLSNDELLNKRVFLVPSVGWEKDVYGPESQQYGIVGGVTFPEYGTMTELVAVDRNDVLLAPEHLTDDEVAAWPLGGVTSWRCVTTKGKVEAGSNVLITGIGGGVALQTLQICVAKGAQVFVTSGSNEKIDKAIKLGAKVGFNYREDSWPSKLKKELNGALLDVVIDSAGGDLFRQLGASLAWGARVVVYGMTAVPSMTFTPREMVRGIELKGTLMGSKAELREATEFLEANKIRPVISMVIEGLENAEQGFQAMREHSQFGKIVVKIWPGDKSKM